jgi:glucokinase
VRATNLPWPELSEAGLARALGAGHVTLLNDLQAVALGVTATRPEDLLVLDAGRPEPGGAIAVIAAGTGLGEAFLTRQGDRWVAHPSEGGHGDFAPVDELELELLRFLLPRLGHVSYEYVCSGVGIPNLYDFLAHHAPGPEPDGVASALAAAADRTRAIVDHGTVPAPAGGGPPPSARCHEVVRLFTRILGSEAGNLALKVLATGGVYIAGGLALAARDELAAGPFLERLRAKGRLADVLRDVPVSIVTSPAALTGAAVAGLQAG